MGLFARLAAVVVALTLALVAPAFADHMTGTYRGTGELDGTTLELQQTGTQLTGQFYGTHSGSLFGQTDGQDYVQGYLDENNIRYTFYAIWTQAGFSLTLYDTNGNTETFMFAGGKAGQPAPTQPAPKPTPPVANYYTFDNGTQSGPFSLQDVLDRIAKGEVGRTTMVWQPGQPEWRPAKDVPELAGNLPPEPPKPARYFAVENGQQAGPFTLEEMIGRIKDGKTVGTDLVWKDGLEAWAAAGTLPELSEALTPVPTPPPAPVPPPAPAPTPEPTPPPPPSAEPTPPPAPEPPPATTTTTTEPTPPAPTTTTTTEPTPPAPTTTTTTEPTPPAPTTTTTTEPAPSAPAPSAPPPSAPMADSGSSSTVSLPDGRNLTIMGGADQSVSSVDGGYELLVDGITIVFANGELTVNGERRDVPEFKTTLTIKVANGEVTATGD